jgi:hypothetical protein
MPAFKFLKDGRSGSNFALNQLRTLGKVWKFVNAGSYRMCTFFKLIVLKNRTIHD